jgi:hypothetical protein
VVSASGPCAPHPHPQAAAAGANPDAPRDSRRPSTYRIAELLGSHQGEGRPVADFLRRLTFTVLLGDNDARAKNLAILHLPGRSDYNLALAIDGSFDHRCVSTARLIREGEQCLALGDGEAERIVTATLANFATALDRVAVPPGVARPRQRSSVERRALANRWGDRRATERVSATA